MVTQSELLMHYKNGYLHYKKIEFVKLICCLNFIGLFLKDSKQ